jgi:MFS family permease
VGQIPAGYLAHRLGAKRVFTISSMIPSVLTLFTPIACETAFPLALMVRAITGLFAAGVLPSVYTFFYNWIVAREKTSMVTFTTSGLHIGSIIGFSLSGYLAGVPLRANGTHLGNWRLLFYLFGFVGVLWTLFWVWFVYERPEDHPLMTPEELALIKTQPAKKYEKINCICRKYRRNFLIMFIYVSFRSVFATEQRLEMTQSLSVSPFHGSLSTPAAADDTNSAAVKRVTVVSERNTEYPFIDRESIESLPFQTVSPPDEVKQRAPWRVFFTTPATLVLLWGNWQIGWIQFMLLSEMPSYLIDELGMSDEVEITLF